ncbi:hypothetical protein QE152_g14368 [Popillia japonica]|uniref:Uncharacterized protein n=1 Tax=Popillia japonica TaxID=7064 RepID=A0AAW1L777_POPJA
MRATICTDSANSIMIYIIDVGVSRFYCKSKMYGHLKEIIMFTKRPELCADFLTLIVKLYVNDNYMQRWINRWN